MRLWADLIFAARLARKHPLSTAAIIATLALCIGVNTAIFSVVDRVLLRALPYPQPDRLIQIVTYGRGEGVEFRNDSQDGATWFALRDHVHALDLAVYTGWTTRVNLASGAGVEYVTLERVGAGYFRVLEVAPLAGREFNPAEDVAGGPMAVILSQKLWRRTFHSNPAIVDSRVLLRGEPHTVVGIMPESLADTADLWAPLRPSTTGEGGGTNYVILARASEQVVRRFVFGITSTDLLTFAAASIGIILIAVVASLAPAVRVSRIDPARSLRQE